MNELLDKEKSLEVFEPGVAPITLEAPRVTSGPRKDAFAPLWNLRSKATCDFQLTRGNRSAKLLWPELAISSGELLELLKTLPRADSLHAALRIGSTCKSLSFDGKLRKSSLQAPDQDGLILYWKRAPQELELLKLPEPGFSPSGEKLARFGLKLADTRAKATLYRSGEMPQPGLFWLYRGRLVGKTVWADWQVEAPFCQVVIELECELNERLREELIEQSKKLARVARQRSAEIKPVPSPSPAPAAAADDLAERLKDSPRFQAAYQGLGEEKPPIVTVLQILEMLGDGAGQVPVAQVRERIGLPEHRLETILGQMDRMLSRDEIVLTLSIDRSVLVLDRERLNRLFALESVSQEANLVRAETMEGEKRAVRLPVEVKLNERRALEALLRYGRLSEQELSHLTSSRRVGGMLERLLSRLESEGFYGLSVVGESAEGRIFALQS